MRHLPVPHHQVKSEVGYHPEIFDDRHSKDGIHGHVIPETEGDVNGAAVMIKVGHFVPDDSGELPMY